MVDWTKEFGYKKYTFTLAETRDLIIATLVLGFLFSIALKNFEVTTSSSIFVNFITAIAIVAPALILHEIAHKFVAQKYGCKANYALWPIGAVMAVLITLLTGGRVIFAALGAVMIATTYSTRLGYRFVGLSNEELGKIAWSGPVVNIAIALFSFFLISFAPLFFETVIMINLIIALFNMIPFPPLDGSKIIGWSWFVWGGTLSLILALYFLPNLIGIIYSLIVAFIIIALIFLAMKLFMPWKHPAIEYR